MSRRRKLVEPCCFTNPNLMVHARLEGFKPRREWNSQLRLGNVSEEDELYKARQLDGSAFVSSFSSYIGTCKMQAELLSLE